MAVSHTPCCISRQLPVLPFPTPYMVRMASLELLPRKFACTNGCLKNHPTCHSCHRQVPRWPEAHAELYKDNTHRCFAKPLQLSMQILRPTCHHAQQGRIADWHNTGSRQVTDNTCAQRAVPCTCLRPAVSQTEAEALQTQPRSKTFMLVAAPRL